MKSKPCIYCSSIADNTTEHCLPKGLGSFKGHHILKNTICKACNKPISIAEEQFLRASPEAFIRQILGIKGRKYHDEISPFYRGSAGAPPIVIKRPYPGSDIEVLWEIIPGTKTLNPLRQILMTVDNVDVIPIPIPRKISSKDELLDILRERNLEKAKPLYFFGNQEDWQTFQDILTQIWPGRRVTHMLLPPRERLKIQANVKIRVTSLYFRAVAKIGFHYFLSVFSDRFNGSEREFDPIRSFIRDGKGQPEEFVFQTKKQILDALHKGFTTKNWGHLLTAEVRNSFIFSKVQFFVGPDNMPQVFEIRLGNNPSRFSFPESNGHFYSYYPEGPKNGYDGEVIPMRKINIMIPR